MIIFVLYEKSLATGKVRKRLNPCRRNLIIWKPDRVMYNHRIKARQVNFIQNILIVMSKKNPMPRMLSQGADMLINGIGVCLVTIVKT